MLVLRFYTTLGCHLCDDALAVVEQVLALQELADVAMNLESVEIADSDELIHQYGKKIPVLGLFENSECLGELAWPFDQKDLVHWLISALSY